MTVVVIIIVAAGALALGIAAGYWLPPHGRHARRERPRPVRRILLPFTGEAISRRSFEAAVRLAKAENATVMPAFLATVPMNLPLQTPLPVQCARGMPLLESIEQKLAAQGVSVDSRVGRGRTARDALRQLLEREEFDRIIVSADEDQHSGLGYEDLRWLLERVPAEILILRTAPEDERRISANAVLGPPKASDLSRSAGAARSTSRPEYR
jgi:nucleotide-binding universal stress UspA family protein